MTVYRKPCTRCGRDKPLEDFHAHPNKRDGLQSWCKACQTEGSRKREAEASAKSRAKWAAIAAENAR